MASNDSPRDCEGFLNPHEEFLDAASGFKDPDVSPDDWDMCRDLIDPLAAILEAWLDEPVKYVTDIEALQLFDPGPDWAREDQRYFNALVRARVELDANLLSSSGRALHKQLRRLATKSREFADTWRRVHGDDDGDDGSRMQTRKNIFVLDGVIPCLRYLRHFSLVMKRKSGAASSRDGGASGGGDGQVAGETGSLITTSGKKSEGGGGAICTPSMSAVSWAEVAIGIDENREYLGVSPRPSPGGVFPRKSATPLELPGRQWKELLDLLAKSENGNTASKKDVMISYKYLTSGNYSAAAVSEMADNPDRMREIQSGRSLLTGAMADLGRKLRKQIGVHTATGDSAVLSVAAKKYVTSAFVVRYLVRGADGRLRFGESKVDG